MENTTICRAPPGMRNLPAKPTLPLWVTVAFLDVVEAGAYARPAAAALRIVAVWAALGDGPHVRENSRWLTPSETALIPPTLLVCDGHTDVETCEDVKTSVMVTISVEVGTQFL